MSRSLNYDLVFGVTTSGLDKAERLLFGESLMTHAMTLTGVTTEVRTSLNPFCWPNVSLDLVFLSMWPYGLVPLLTDWWL